MNKNSEIAKLINKAEKNIKTVKVNLAKNFYDSAVSRAYYAMFYCAEAMLLTKNLRFSKHSAVHSAFGKHFAKTGEIKTELHKMLLDAFNLRGRADYEYMIEVTKEEAEKVLKDAEFFVGEIKKKLNEKDF